MDVEKAVNGIRAIRHFAPRPLSDQDLGAILEAGRHAGSSKNLQRWQFIVVLDRDDSSSWPPWAPQPDIWPAAAPRSPWSRLTRCTDAPLSITWDSGRAAQNMMLVAWNRGIGSVTATVHDQELCRSILRYGADEHCEYILNFGYPAETRLIERSPRAGGRKGLDEVVRWDR